MFNTLPSLAHFRIVCLTVLVGGLIGCGGSDVPPGADPDSRESTSKDRQVESIEETTDTIPGSVSFSVDGEPRNFSYLPAEKNVSMSVSTMAFAKPAVDSVEEFSLLLTSFNLSEAELPVTLELGLRKAMESDDPSGFATSPKPMMSYITPDGVDYSSYVEVMLDSYEDGLLIGRVADKEFYPAGKDDEAAGPLMLSDIRFEIEL